jgi:ferritin
MNEKVMELMNKQIANEFGSAYLYLAVAAYFESKNLKGLSGWMRKQASEEMTHGMKLFDHLIDRGAMVHMGAIEEPKNAWNSLLEAFEDSLKHEKKVTGQINALMQVAQSSNDFASASFLKWFIDEQVEEEVNAAENVERIRMAGNDSAAILLLDHELGSRK